MDQFVYIGGPFSLIGAKPPIDNPVRPTIRLIHICRGTRDISPSPGGRGEFLTKLKNSEEFEGGLNDKRKGKEEKRTE